MSEHGSDIQPRILCVHIKVCLCGTACGIRYTITIRVLNEAWESVCFPRHAYQPSHPVNQDHSQNLLRRTQRSLFSIPVGKLVSIQHGVGEWTLDSKIGQIKP